MKRLLPLGAPLDAVPHRMHAQVIRPERYGAPSRAWRGEEVDVPSLGPRQVLLQVMAAGVNYNGIWTASGRPLDVIARRLARGDDLPFHIGGSDASGVVAAVGPGVEGVAVGDEVIVDGNIWDPECPLVRAGDPTLSPTARVLGYEENFGTFAQFARVHDYQCHPKPAALDWHEAASLCASGGSAHRMLFGWPPHTVERGDVVLVWGGAGGLGAMAVQLVALAGGLPIAVVSGERRAAFCRSLGAVGTIDRREFGHWGPQREGDETWLEGARAFGARIWDLLGERRSPRIVVEHPGQSTLPTSVYVCAPGGMVVTCAGTTGALGTFDLRHHWMRQKRIQGSHMYAPHDARRVIALAAEGQLRPSHTAAYAFDEVGAAHEHLASGRTMGKVTLHVGTTRA